MFRVSRRLDYGLQLMIALAAVSENQSQTTGALAKKLNVPLPFLYQISHILIRSGMVRAQSGPHGGLQLSKPAKQIRVLDIVKAIEGNLSLNPCIDSKGQTKAACVTSDIWENLELRINQFLENTSLDTLI